MIKPIALVTGASRGLGCALAELLGRTHHVIAVARTVGALENLDDRIKGAGGTVTLAPTDLTEDRATQELCRAIHDRWGRIDLWVHTAIYAGSLSPVGHIDLQDWQQAIAVNLDATFRLVTYLTPLLKTQASAVFFDDADKFGAKFFGAYGSTKSSQISFVRSWAAETTKTGPLVRILAPRPMATVLRARFFPGEDICKLATAMAEADRILPEILLVNGPG